MDHIYLGQIAALSVSICWTFSALFFEKAGRAIGSMSVNFIRLFLAIIFLTITTCITKGMFLPLDASLHQWFWLGLSGFVGLFLGDLLLFRSYMLIGSRTSALIMSLAPMLTAVIGWFFLDEKLSPKNITAICVSMFGIIIAISNRNMKLNIPFKGFLLAFGGALGQAAGLILSKKGMGTYDPIAATQIRALFGIVGFIILITTMKRWKKIWNSVSDIKSMKQVTIGTIFGPFIGVSLSLYAIQQTQTGIASTLMALVPVFIIWPSAIMFKEKIKFQHIVGAIITIAGISLFFLK